MEILVNYITSSKTEGSMTITLHTSSGDTKLVDDIIEHIQDFLKTKDTIVIRNMIKLDQFKTGVKNG